MENKLKKLGFSQNLATAYLTLLKLGKARAGDVINQSGLQRSVVYSALDELVSRELVSKIEVKGVATFSINDPASLVNELEEKKEFAQKIAEELKQQQGVAPREVSVSEGLDAIMRATDRSLFAPPGETMYVLGASSLNVQPILDEHWHKYHKKRIKKGVHFRGLYDRTVPQSAIDYRNSIAMSEARYLPEGLEMPIWFNICLDVVSIMVPGDEPPLVFTVRSKPTALAMKKYFEYFWKLSTKSKT
jgi:sugar-specific transcriptional regulator TrmB